METSQTLVAGIATLAIFSFLIRENPLFRFFEHLFIGIAAGYGTVLGIKDFLWPIILRPMLGYDRVPFPDGTYATPEQPWLWLYLIPIFLGLLYYTIYSPRWSWLARSVIGLGLGASAGLTLKGFFAEMMPQIYESFKPLLVFDAAGLNYMESFSNIVFVVTLISVMVYFFFTFRTNGVVFQRTARLGRWCMMLCFGAFFGSTVMARMALLVERLEFLLVKWWNTLWTIGG